jgi:hypothetical protein
MRLFDFVLVSLITASLAAVLVVFQRDEMPYPQPPPAAFRAELRSRPWAGICLHASGTRRGNLSELDRAHAGEGGAPFHFVLGNGAGSADGAVEESPRWREQREGRNPDVIEICLVGDLNRTHETRAQEAALIRLLTRLCREKMIPSSEIYAESERRPALACPGACFDPKFYRSKVREALAR